MNYEHIRLEIESGIARLTLFRPDKLNAFTPTMRDEMIDAFDVIDRDDAIRAVIVTGAGRAFCAGADLSAGGATFDAEAMRGTGESDHRDGGGLVTLRIFDCLKPVIAAINGPAVGVGITMTLPMDIRLVSSEARIGFVFARRGIVPESASSWFLPRVVGIPQALEWSLSGRIFGPDEALAGGLVKAVLPADELLPAAEAIAREIADNCSAVSVALVRQMMWRGLDADHPMDMHKIDSRAMYAMGRAADAREGVTSFLEKRPAKFTMAPSRDMPSVYPWWAPREFK